LITARTGRVLRAKASDFARSAACAFLRLLDPRVAELDAASLSSGGGLLRDAAASGALHGLAAAAINFSTKSCAASPSYSRPVWSIAKQTDSPSGVDFAATKKAGLRGFLAAKNSNVWRARTLDLGNSLTPL
jgi:hypothetical protein